MSKQKSAKKQSPSFDEMDLLELNAAGLDIGAEEIWACVPRDRDEKFTRPFGTYTAELNALADWLEACQIETVAMESTGVYWIPIYQILEERGIAVSLVNARHLKNVPGRHTDVLACQWLQKLHSYGLLRASFRPAEEICTLRALVRQRQELIQSRARQIQLMQKAMEQMNVKLTEVVSDITGITGMSIIRAILQGEREPKQLAQLRNHQCKKSEEEIALALEGSYQYEHLFALRQAVATYDFYGQQLQECDQAIEKYFETMSDVPPGDDTSPPQTGNRKRRKNQPHFDLTTMLYQKVGVDLTEIDGIDALTAQTVIAEVGLDMSRWRTVKHFANWLGLSPNNDISGGKILRTWTKKTKNRAAVALRNAAQSLHRSDSALGAFYRRIRAKHGAPKAVTATAHKLARIIYFMLRDKTPYRDQGAEAYDQQQQERTIRNLKRRAARLGMQLVPLDTNSDNELVPEVAAVVS